MTAIVAHFTNNAVPLTSPGNVPTIRIRRTDTGALVVTDAAMTELGDGEFRYDFSPTDGIEYSIRADGDPTAAGQVTASERYQWGVLSGTDVARLETDIPAILVDTGTTIPAQLTAEFAALNDLSQADVQAALTAQGYTSVRASLLDNLDAAISTSVASILAAISGLNDISTADVQAAITAQGYTSVRAVLLDNLDAAISTSVTSILAAIAGLNDLSQADVQAALTAQGYTSVRAVLLDNLDAAISTSVTSILAAISALNDPTSAAIASAVLDEALSAHTTSGSLGQGVARLFGGNTRTKLYFATAAIATATRTVPNGGVSHMEVSVRNEGGVFPGSVYFVVFNYDPSDTSTSAPRSSTVVTTAPVDGSFSSTEFPV